MKKSNRNNPNDIRSFLKSFSPEFIQKKNNEQYEENKKMFNEFKDAYLKGCCSLCGNKLNSFYPEEYCFHWFLKPAGVKKKHFKDFLAEPIGFNKLESYFRWMATLDKFIKNINDLSNEISESKLREVTIKFKNIEWSLNYGQSDLDGHSNSKNANFPHFHLQMLVDKQPFIRFNDYHIPFSKADLFDIRLKNEASDLVGFGHSQGPGMSLIEDEVFLKEFDKVSKVSDNMETAMFNSQTIVEMPDGKTMPNDKINEIMKESRETKIPIRVLMQKYFPEAKIITQIIPADGVPEMKKRNKR